MNEKYAPMIITFPLFSGFTLDGAHMLLDCGEVRELSPGGILIKEGDDPTFVLLVLTGKLEVFVERHGRDLILMKPVPARFSVNWLSCAAFRDRPRCGQPRTLPSCNGLPRVFVGSFSTMFSYRSGSSANRCAR